jgi:ParD-like antitoxin of type II bacterial toxin-antitoxin system
LTLYGAKCAIKELFMTAVKNFASVKLPESLVQQARDAAQPLRRSAAGQIEYWATLGRVVEHSGLTVQEARIAIENYEAAAGKAGQAAGASDSNSQANELIAQFMAIEADGSLAQRVREVVAENRSKALRFAA